MIRFRACLVTLTVVLSAAAVSAQPKKIDPRMAFTDAAKAGESFKIQGEYAGTLTAGDKSAEVGIQVIALSEEKFRAVGYVGGLPGDGWNGEEPYSTEGTLESGVVKFVHPKRGSGVWKDGAITVTSPDGDALGTLKKVARQSKTLGAKPPAGAVVLFDGSTADHFKGGRLTDDRLLMVGVTSKKTFQSCKVHIEFRTPYMPHASGQGRGNSGLYLQGRYEVQILDSFGLAGKHNECGGIYETRDPDVNMCYPPLAWQTYDIEFTAAVYEGDKKVKNARITVRHNDVLVHEDVELPKGTRAHPVKEGPDGGPVYLQNHGNPVTFRNIWVVAK